MEKIVIVGGVAAGATAAAKVRRISSTAQITMLELGPDISFANCGLPYYIGGDIKSRSKLILQSPESFKEQYDVDVYTHTLVSSIDRSAHTVTTIDTRSGEQNTFEYTKLILAQGGRPVVPTLPGAMYEHVFSLWTLEDMDKITRHLNEKKPKNAVVVGGGFIGLEMVEALVKRGLTVNVVEMMPHVMSIMDAETAGFIERELLSYGVGIHTNVGVSEITTNRVKLDNGSMLDADMVLLSIGVRPTLQLAKEAVLQLGESGGLLVTPQLQTSDPDIYAAGDMIEIEHRVSGKKVRIPLAGPANRQGRIAAENVMGGNHSYKGSLGTSVVRVFEAVAGTTGLSLKQAHAAGIEADAVVVHKEHHTSYYPNAETVTVSVVYDRHSGVIIGGQAAGYKGADKRLDVIATATASKMTVYDLADVDFAYSPPIGTANDALNMAAYTAENKLSGFSPSVTVAELDAFVEGKNPLFVDVRDYFAFEKNHILGATHLPLELLSNQIGAIPTDRFIVVYDETGKKGHQTLRTLKGMGFTQVTNISGGYISLQRQAQTVGFKNFKIDVLPIQLKSLKEEQEEEQVDPAAKQTDQNAPIVVDVRTPGEYKSGAYPDAINISLDEIPTRYAELGKNASREIVVYCATGARSAYAENMLRQLGFTNVKNGGGLSMMMARQASGSKTTASNEPLVVDVRSVPEFRGGAIPGAINIPLDELPEHIGKLGDYSRDITVYCASGARSSYAQQILMKVGFTNVKNGGGIMQMMMRR
ncbi:NADPH-dependent 2,4-dienoyl-CoA reductase, sulfur reductase [Williamwhitmania taraxaci]|uniref:NADPH-dependent 2,4-dienoyl-CoA reductase, sulfur reductase n=2 Tax=Williamwhitmania taraxaci TaxID=1640674 RepID=A0A1G6S805_9BACT|nr:NADPH-dependent 2,4-dienoyl-CoA reductase, sulfur reductase [Williamwhitmania taraxaci]